MTTPRTIIVATDFSASATRAVNQAAYLAQAWDAKLILVHVFNDSVWASLKAVYNLPGWNDVQPLVSQRARLTKLAAEIAQEFALSVDTEVLSGRASQQIGAIVTARNADLLVVGEHGENWVNDVVLGGTALKVIEAARVPVLLVRRENPVLYRDILIAADFSASSERAARFSLAVFPAAQKVLIHAWLVPLEASMRLGGAREEDIEHYRAREFARAEAGLVSLMRKLDAAHTRLQPLALQGSPASVIFDQAEARGSDLIVIGKHGGSALDERLLGSVTQNILYHATCDVLLSA